MKEFTDKVAVITGASNGIGFGIADRCAQEGMKVVLGGINLENLLEAEKKLEHHGVETLCVQVDVSKCGDIEGLAKKTIDKYGKVHLLVNNAGMGAGLSIWESTWSDWEWVMGVNLWGTIYGVKVFVPIMLEQDEPCHIVNTSSIAGLLPYQPSAPYQVTKHAVVALTENLQYSLIQKETKIRASVLCPGYVKTRVMDAERNRPAELENEPVEMSREQIAVVRYLQKNVDRGISPQNVAEVLFKAIGEERLYISTHPELNPRVQERMDAIMQDLEIVYIKCNDK
jgi:NAD(P)-dependent dehydrogenase (short-subunit alcohol dehydrogenase family)